MKLYKYKSIENLWHVLDVVLNHRLYCAHWSELNDPLEGRYEIYLGQGEARMQELMVGRIEAAKNKYRVASLSADPANFLLWSHYADGHKGVAIEVEIPEDHKDLIAIMYTPFSSVFSHKLQTREDMRHLFNGKGEEWQYEQEFRIVVPRKYFKLPSKVSRILLGPRVRHEEEQLLRAVLPPAVQVVSMRLNKTQGTLSVIATNGSSL